MKIIVTSHPKKREALKIKEDIKKYLVEYGHEVVSSSKSADLVIGLGGDGFTARLVAELSPRKIPSLVINAGDVGFLTVGNTSNWMEVLEKINTKQYKIEERIGLELLYNGKRIGPIANDIYLRHSKSVAHFKIKLNGNILHKDLVADGITVSTPTGSTGYNTSNGGPIVQPGVECMLLGYISPMSLNTRPIVAGSDSLISIEATKSKKPGYVSVVADGKDLGRLNERKKITVRKHRTKLLFAVLDYHDFYRALQDKKGLMR